MGEVYQAISTKVGNLGNLFLKVVFLRGDVRCNRQELCAFIRADFESLVIGDAGTPFNLHVSLPHTL